MTQHDPLSAELIHAELKGRLNEQNAQIATLDSKANFGLGSASLLTAGIIALQTSVQGRGFLVNLLTSACLGAYIVVVWFSYQAYRLRTFATPPKPAPFARKYMYYHPDVTREHLISELINAYSRNLRPIRDKIRYTELLHKALLAEATLLMLIACAEIFF